MTHCSRYDVFHGKLRRLATKGLTVAVAAVAASWGGPSQVALASEASAAQAPIIPLMAAVSVVDTLRAGTYRFYGRSRATVPPADPITVEIHRLDKQCEDFVTEARVVSQADRLHQTITAVLQGYAAPHLDLSGYRTAIDADRGHLTIDFRVSAESQRLLQSLAVCEQKAIFGSLRRTLLSQPDWGIHSVALTNRGADLVF